MPVARERQQAEASAGADSAAARGHSGSGSACTTMTDTDRVPAPTPLVDGHLDKRVCVPTRSSGPTMASTTTPGSVRSRPSRSRTGASRRAAGEAGGATAPVAPAGLEQARGDHHGVPSGTAGAAAPRAWARRPAARLGASCTCGTMP
ncbi:MAG: hypothetical protein QM757_14635 [Paludibaculum sp.]